MRRFVQGDKKTESHRAVQTSSNEGGLKNSSGQCDLEPQRLSKRKGMGHRKQTKYDDYQEDTPVAWNPKNPHARPGGMYNLDEDKDRRVPDGDNLSDWSRRKSQAPGSGARNAPTEENQYKGHGESAAKNMVRNFLKKVRETPDGEQADQAGDTDIDIDIQQLEEYIDKLKAEHESQVSAFQASMQQEKEHNSKLKESLNKMQFAMESKDLFIGQQDSDDMIHTRFQALVSKIKTWSVPFAQGHPSMSRAFSEAELEHAKKVVPDLAEVIDLHRFLHVPKNMRLFVRGIVGLAMTDTVFRATPHDFSAPFSGQDVWMDQDLAIATATVEEGFFYSDRKAVPLSDLHDWRALTANIISRLNVSSKTGKGMEACITQCSTRILSLVQDWVRPDVCKTLHKDLQEILLEAVGFSRTLRCQRACWTVRHPVGVSTFTGSVILDERVMDDVHGDDDSDTEGMRARHKRAVDIIASPALFKRGDSDGKRFDVETCVVKAEVRSKKMRLSGRA